MFDTIRPRTNGLAAGAIGLTLALSLGACAEQQQQQEEVEDSRARAVFAKPVRIVDAQPFGMTSPVDAARQYMFENRTLLGLSEHTDFTVRSAGQDGIRQHIRLDQTHRGIEVWGAQAVVHTANGAIERVNGNLLHGLDEFDPEVMYDDAYAMEMARADYARASSGTQLLSYQRESVELVIYMKDKAPHLAWHTHFYVDPQDGIPAGRWHHFIDAESGVMLDGFNWLTTVPVQGSGPGGNPNIARTWNMELDVEPAGANYMMDTTADADIALPTVHAMTTEDYNNGTANGQIVVGPLAAVGDSTENDAHGFTEVVLDMMYNWYGFDSIQDMSPNMVSADDGYAINSRVHYSNNNDNAYWDGTQMTYYDGSGTVFYDLTGDLDVVGHEINHGFTENHSDLIYNSNESGGLNESFSDVAGTVAEFYDEGDGPTGADFDIGADVTVPGGLPWPGDALRFMCNPPQDTNSVDHYNDFYVGLDNHYSSGIPNKAFCLAASRLSDPMNYDPATPATVAGAQLAGWVWYYANAFEWTTSETFAQACDGIVAQAQAAGFSAGQIQALVDSWLDVGVACNGQSPPINCDAIWTADAGVISSPNYPNNYPNNWAFTDCIQPASGGVATLTFLDFRTEDGFDFVNIIDGNTGMVLVADHSGNALPPDTSSTFLAVRFTSDGLIARRGWEAQWGTTGGNTPPVADFTFVATDLSVAFTDASTDADGTVVAWDWDFGDGNTDTVQNPNHTYAAGGTYTVSLTVTDDQGGTNTATQSVTVTEPNVPPVASFTFVATDLSVAFTDTSTDADGTIVAWAWNFGDGNTDVVQNPSHTYAAGGTYTVTLIVTDDAGDTDTATQSVTVVEPNVPPVADFTYVAMNLAVSFMDTSVDPDGTIVSWAWTFGDGNTSTLQNPNHMYAAGGTYTVSLTVTDDAGDANTVSQSVTVVEPNVPPVADFTYVATDLSVDFTDASADADGTIVSWSWDFGDGNTDTVQNPSHTYAAGGTFAVSLTVTDDRGDSDTATQSVTVVAPNVPPVADFTYAATDLSVVFTDASTDADGAIVSWSWDFGDSNVATVQDPSHTYAAAGTYTVSLTVIDDSGDAGSTTQNVTVVAPPNDLPTAAFTYVATDLSVDFTDASTDADGTIVSWSWDFGDGNTDTVQNPGHTYAAGGTYDVTLTVTDDRGDTASATQSITVDPANVLPTADFLYAATNLSVDFTDTSADADGSLSAWSWDFGDGATSADQHPTHVYAAAGSYDVTLTVTDDRGGAQSVTQSVTVQEVEEPTPGGGCCDTNGQKEPPWAALIVVVGLVVMRRRRRLEA